MKYRHDKKYLYSAVAAFCVIAAGVTFAVIMFNLPSVLSGLRAVLNILAPVLCGLGIAYALNPIVRRVENHLRPWLQIHLSAKTSRTLGRLSGVIVAFAIVILILYLLISLLVPQLLESLQTIILNLSTYFSNIENWLTALLDDNPGLESSVSLIIDRVYDYVVDFLQNDLVARTQSVMHGLTSSVISLVGGLVDLVIGLIISVYVLFSKDSFVAQAKKITVAFFKPDTADWLMRMTIRADHVFGGFILGKLVDSLIIGVLCYLCMLVLGLPFPALVSVIIGVTNIIPFFGPYIGAIPSTLLILVVNPLQGLYFMIFILALQQVDGNIIGPRILGDATGLTGFWVVLAITLFGGLFGLAGMILGVPIFAMIYTILSDLVNHCLKNKGRSTVTADYYAIQSVADLDGTPAEEAATESTSEDPPPAASAPDADGAVPSEPTEKPQETR